MAQCVICCSVGPWEPYVSCWQNLALELSDSVASLCSVPAPLRIQNLLISIMDFLLPNLKFVQSLVLRLCYLFFIFIIYTFI